ncbi:hypothetical protein [Stieleria tagensis]|uniref:hypothetical protein n=1 Tax=Stieleria tagensis TaxID=2956795 RepID=UPI0028F44C57|nr:hypothetical protein [Stieleria tagensis]
MPRDFDLLLRDALRDDLFGDALEVAVTVDVDLPADGAPFFDFIDELLDFVPPDLLLLDLEAVPFDCEGDFDCAPDAEDFRRSRRWVLLIASTSSSFRMPCQPAMP